MLANKQDAPTSLSVSEVRESFDAWTRARTSNSEGRDRKGKGKATDGQGQGQGEAGKLESGGEEAEHGWDDSADAGDGGAARDERMASLDVMGVSALEG